MRVLCACEESQQVTIAFREMGHDAYSCDVESCSGGYPEWHIQSDVTQILKLEWDMVIAFPPCTYLSNAGAVRMFPGKQLDQKRFEKMMEAKAFFNMFLAHKCPRIAIENPRPLTIADLPRESQVIQPYEFGDPVRKATLLWLKGLPPLLPILGPGIVKPRMNWISAGPKGRPAHAVLAKHRDRKTRSKTFPGIAKAMAEQWGRLK
jgi:hypothetical protein